MGRLTEDLHVEGNFTAKAIGLPASCVTDAAIAPGANIDAAKIAGRFTIPVELFAAGTTVASLASRLLHIVRGATGTLIALRAVAITAPVGGDRKFTVDLQKSTSGGAFATVLTTPLEFSVATSAADRIAKTAVINTSGLVAGDLLQLVVTASGSTGTQGAGLLVDLLLDEKPQ